MSNYDEFDLVIIQTGSIGNSVGPDSIVSVIIVCSAPCILTEGSCLCTNDCSNPNETCGTGCQITTSITVK